MELYGRAVKNGAAKSYNKTSSGSTTDLSKMSPLEKKKEIARRKADAQKEKVTVIIFGDCCPLKPSVLWARLGVIMF